MSDFQQSRTQSWAAYDAWLAARGMAVGPVTIEEMAAAGWTVNQWRAARHQLPVLDGDRLLSAVLTPRHLSRSGDTT